MQTLQIIRSGQAVVLMFLSNRHCLNYRESLCEHMSVHMTVWVYSGYSVSLYYVVILYPARHHIICVYQ